MPLRTLAMPPKTLANPKSLVWTTLCDASCHELGKTDQRRSSSAARMVKCFQRDHDQTVLVQSICVDNHVEHVHYEVQSTVGTNDRGFDQTKRYHLMYVVAKHHNHHMIRGMHLFESLMNVLLAQCLSTEGLHNEKGTIHILLHLPGWCASQS